MQTCDCGRFMLKTGAYAPYAIGAAKPLQNGAPSREEWFALPILKTRPKNDIVDGGCERPHGATHQDFLQGARHGNRLPDQTRTQRPDFRARWGCLSGC